MTERSADIIPSDDPDPRDLYGVELRYVLTDLIDGPEQRVWTVAELVGPLGR